MKVVIARRWSLIDTVIIGSVFCLLWLLVWRAESLLQYNWGWDTPLSYVFSYSPDKGWEAGLLWQGFITSLRLFVWAGLLSLLIGTVIAVMSLSKIQIIRWMAVAFVESLRHLPPLVFMFLFFFFISSQFVDSTIWQFIINLLTDNVFFSFLLGDSKGLENLLSGIICLAVFEAAFVAEIIRGGILSIEKSQWDGGKSVGLTSWQIALLIIFPQVVRKIAVPIIGQLIILIKNSAVLSVISIQELSFSGQETAVSTQHTFETWLLLAGLYMLLCLPLIWLANYLSKTQ